MKHRNSQPHQTTWRIIVRSASVTALSVALAAGLPQPAYAGDVTSPPVPPNLEVPPGNKAFLVGYAAGTQNYVCLPAGSKFAWTFFGPQATLFDDDEEQIITHFLSPNPDEGGTPRATWQHSRDTSAVWARAIASSSDPAFVAPGAIPWLLLETVGAQDGPTGGDGLSNTTFIQRVNTAGGVAPTSGCKRSTVGKKALVPYTTDYFFYKALDGTSPLDPSSQETQRDGGEGSSLYTLTISEEGFDPPTIDVVTGDQIELIWTGDGASIEVQTSYQNGDREEGVPLFNGGDGYTYAVSSTGTTYTIQDVPEGEYHIYRTVSGSVRGSVLKLRKRT